MPILWMKKKLWYRTMKEIAQDHVVVGTGLDFRPDPRAMMLLFP